MVIHADVYKGRARANLLSPTPWGCTKTPSLTPCFPHTDLSFLPQYALRACLEQFSQASSACVTLHTRIHLLHRCLSKACLCLYNQPHVSLPPPITPTASRTKRRSPHLMV